MKLCIDCPNRTINCHSYCKYYLKFRKKKLKEYEEKAIKEYENYTAEKLRLVIYGCCNSYR